MEHSGFYRRVPAGTPGAVWEEGCGYVVYDEQARIEGQALARQRDIAFWRQEEGKALASLSEARAKLRSLRTDSLTDFILSDDSPVTAEDQPAIAMFNAAISAAQQQIR
jgi:hypothetical protein